MKENFLSFVFKSLLFLCQDDSVFENAPCGICLDVVIDRGVLDCCDHW